MGIINVTPDSFSDGAPQAVSAEAATTAARVHVAAGAHVLDLGAESTRPNFQAVTSEEELARLEPAFRAVRAEFPDIPISIDTGKGRVAARMLTLGATIINDVTCGQDERLIAAVADSGAQLVLMHGRRQRFDRESPGASVARELERAMARAIKAGIGEADICLDPGVGFGKAGDENWRLLRELAPLRLLGRPLLIGLSRKRFLAPTRSPRDRGAETNAACALAVTWGADALRVHDVAACRRPAALGWAARAPSADPQR